MANARADDKRPWPGALWESYWNSDKSVSVRDEIVTHFHSLVAPFVARLRRRLPGRVDPDLVESAAGQGLMEAVEQFDPTKSDHFRCFAHMVMRRKVIDALRREDARCCHEGIRNEKHRARMELMLSQQLGRRPSPEEVEQFLRDESQKAIVQTSSMCRARGGENRRHGRRDAAGPGADQALPSLEIRNAAIVRLYLAGHLSQQRIAEFFGISQARVSQVLQRMRER